MRGHSILDRLICQQAAITPVSKLFRNVTRDHARGCQERAQASTAQTGVRQTKRVIFR
jgi:hypothetical protein